MYLQITVKELKDGYAICNLQTGNRDVTILMPESEYFKLVKDGFFIRGGRHRDSSGILNISRAYSADDQEGQVIVNFFYRSSSEKQQAAMLQLGDQLMKALQYPYKQSWYRIGADKNPDRANLYVVGIDGEEVFGRIEQTLRQNPLMHNAKVTIISGKKGEAVREMIL